MEPTAFIMMVGLAVLVGLAILALFHSAFEDNLLQFYGLWGMVFGGTGKIVQLLAGGWASAEATVFVCGAALFGVGTYQKVRKHHKAKKENGGGVGIKTH